LQRLQEKIKDTWVGPKVGEAPQVKVVESLEEMTEEIGGGYEIPITGLIECPRGW